jgi:hypothetical protein
MKEKRKTVMEGAPHSSGIAGFMNCTIRGLFEVEQRIMERGRVPFRAYCNTILVDKSILLRKICLIRNDIMVVIEKYFKQSISGYPHG